MKKSLIALLTAATLTMATAPAYAQQCVPYARAASGVALRGDAWTWWASADGSYEKGVAPREGAVMVFKKTGSMRHGHVAVVTKIVNKRTVLVDHANWAPRRGASRGKVTEDAAVMDVSPRNDWSQLRVWYAPVKDFGTKVYPAYGFIYPKKGGKGGLMQAAYHPADNSAVDAFAAANGDFDPFNDSDEMTSAATAPQIQPVTSAPLAQIAVKPEAPKAEAAPQQQAMAAPEPVKTEAPKVEAAKTEVVKVIESPKLEAAPAPHKTEAQPAKAEEPAKPAKAEEPAKSLKAEEAAKPAKGGKAQHAKTQKHMKMDVTAQAEAAPASAEQPKAEAQSDLWDGDALAAKLAGSGSYGGRSGS